MTSTEVVVKKKPLDWIDPLAYDPTEDYKKKHMDFFKEKDNENFRGHFNVKGWIQRDVEMIQQIHQMENCTNYVAWTFYANDLVKKHGKQLRAKAEKEEACKLMGIQMPSENKQWFVTIGFEKTQFTVDKLLKCVTDFKAYDWVVKCKIVAEFFTEHGWRPHIMMRLETPPTYGERKKPMCKSVLIEVIFKSSGFKRRGLVEAKNHIDIQPFLARHNEYLNLFKEESKTEYLIRDEEYRRNEGLPDFWEK